MSPADLRCLPLENLLGELGRRLDDMLASSAPADDPIIALRDGLPGLGLSGRTLLDAHRAGGLAAVRIGRRLVARRSAIVAWIDSKAPAPPRRAQPEHDDGGRCRSKLVRRDLGVTPISKLVARGSRGAR